MKKTGFTLAEVLITLSIIGIVAMMTLPALMTNVQEQQAKTGLKKGLNTLIEAAQMNQAIEGFAYDTLRNDDIGENSQSMTGLLLQRTQIDTQKSGISAGSDVPVEDPETHQVTQVFTIAKGASAQAVDSTPGNHVVFFRDGSALSYPGKIITSNPNLAVRQTDGLPLGFNVLYDINGSKAPNRVSNCAANADMLASAANDDDVVAATATASTALDNAGSNSDTACTRTKRVIRDQFLIRVRGTFAQPEGSAAWWAFNH